MRAVDITADEPKRGSGALTPAGGPMGRLRYAAAYFGSLPPEIRRQRLKKWAAKPGLFSRTIRFVFPGFAGRKATTSLGLSRLLPAPSYSAVSTWHEARDRTLAEVCEIMDAAGIDHAVVDETGSTRHQVAIDVADRQRWLDALERHGDDGLWIAAHPSTDDARLEVGSKETAAKRIMRRRVALADSFTVCRYQRLEGSNRVLGLAFGTSVSCWSRDRSHDGAVTVRSSAPNRWGTSISTVVDDGGEPSTAEIVRTHLPSSRHVDDPEHPVDLVVLWVDGDDPAWMERRNERLVELGREPDARLTEEATEARLYRSRDELKYALRSVRMWAPFVNHVYLVTDRQRPSWLTPTDGLTVVDHSEILPPDALPTFNSNAIDTALHRIPGLSEHFLVTNDDMMFVGPSFAGDFFATGGLPRMFLSRAQIPLGDDTASAPAVDSAARRNRELVHERHGVVISQKFKHIMIPQTRSLRLESEERFSESVHSTARRPFRDHRDIAFSHLCLYDALATGRAVTGSLPYDYVDLGSSRMAWRLKEIEQAPGRLKVLCLNDSDGEVVLDDFGRPVGEIELSPHRRDAMIAQFLESAFPVPSPWETEPSVPAHTNIHEETAE